MPFPNFAEKHAQEALFTASDFLEYLHQSGLLPEIPAPDAAVLLYQPEVLSALLGERRPPDLRLFAAVHVVERDGRRAAVVSGFGVGAPAAALVMEHLIAWGVRRFLSVGIAGGLQPGMAVGDVVVCTGAVRDEGVSHHYAPDARTAVPSYALTAELEAVLRQRGVRHASGESWTVDAPYRETVAEARHYQGQGVLSVEMEAAALFTVAAQRGVDVAAVFAMSDSLAEARWNPRFFDPDLQAALARLAAVALECALRGPRGGGD
jgi:uridine phosphorylase